jgi:polysaccharide biosynthesis transport protein
MAEIKPESPRRAQGAPSRKAAQVSVDHYVKLILHRKWLVTAIFAVVSCGVALYVRRLPDIYTSETLIMVDPQKVPESYVKSTVTGDVRNRLGTLSQQILSATRLQKIIDSFNLYPEERKVQPREDVINRMRADIRTVVATDFGGSLELQAFRISYRGRDPRAVAQVTNQLASLFIEENLKAREAQATGTTEFLTNQLQETRKDLEVQEGRLRDFKLKHLGEMPEHQAANLQFLGQLQAQLQLVNEGLARAEQQKALTQSMMKQEPPAVVELEDTPKLSRAKGAEETGARARTPLETDKARLAALLSRYTDRHPDVLKLKIRIAQQEAEASRQTPNVEANERPPAAPEPAPIKRAAPTPHYNPVLQAQLDAAEAEVGKGREEQRRLSTAIAGYRRRVEAIPVREQEIAELQRDYEMSKAHYAQLLDKQLSAETATQLEIRQKGEKFTVVDPAVAADRPTSPDRLLIMGAGLIAGIVLGLLAAAGTELFGITIIDAIDIGPTTVLGVVPIIRTRAERKVRKKRIVIAASAVCAMVVGAAVYVFGPGGYRL